MQMAKVRIHYVNLKLARLTPLQACLCADIHLRQHTRPLQTKLTYISSTLVFQAASVSLSYIRAPPHRRTHTPSKGSHHGNKQKKTQKNTVRKRIQAEREREVFNKLKRERVWDKEQTDGKAPSDGEERRRVFPFCGHIGPKADQRQRPVASGSFSVFFHTLSIHIH